MQQKGDREPLFLPLQGLFGLREQDAELVVVAHQLEGGNRLSTEKHLQHLVEQPRRRNPGKQFAELYQGSLRLLFQPETQLGGESHCAQHAHRVLPVALPRIPNQPQDPVVEIFQTPGVIDDGVILDIVVEGIDGEITAHGILFQGAIDVVAYHHAVAGLALPVASLPMMSTEGGYLDDLAAEIDVGQAETAANEAAVAEQLPHPLRRGIGGHVEILGLSPQQQITHPAPHQIGFVTGIFQAIHHLHSVGADLFAGNGMFGAGDDDRNRCWLRVSCPYFPKSLEPGEHFGIISHSNQARKKTAPIV